MGRYAVSAVAMIAVGAAGCDLVGPSCIARQRSGVAATYSGTVEAGQTLTVPLTYDPRGTQNDVHITWAGRQDPGGPRPQFFATLPDCTDFKPPALDGRYVPNGSCSVIGGFGGTIAPEARECARNQTCSPLPGEVLINNIIITGPGIGAAAGYSRYALQIVGDPNRATTYSVEVTWFSGPDC